MALKKDAPIRADVQRAGCMLSLPILGGLHHRYARVRVFDKDKDENAGAASRRV
jgi:hypothetical protein